MTDRPTPEQQREAFYDEYDAIDIFAGPGGWDLAARDLGLHALGIEWDQNTCATRANADLPTLHGDVSEQDPTHYRRTRGLIASPPCPAFSAAGKRSGVEHLDALCHAVRECDWFARPSPDPEVWLVLEVGRWWDLMAPRWIVCEQVPAVLPIWEAYRDVLRTSGYSAWCGELNAADYGVPQTRRRAFLIASCDRTAGPPPPTHARDPHPSLFGDDLLPWVTMAQALGWGATAQTAFTVAPGKSPDDGMGKLTRQRYELIVNTGRDWKPGGTREDAQTVDAGVQPAPTVDTKGRWWLERPATTVCGDPRLSGPGRNDPDEPGSQYGENSVRLGISEALVLQSFPPDYPLAGSRTNQFKQVGNAVPPLMARRVLEVVA